MSSSSSPEISNTLLALSTNLADAVEQANQCVVAVKARRRFSSSGIYWRPGVIVTADETIKRTDDITVTLYDGCTLPATLVGRDASKDVAVLKIADIELPMAQIGDTALLKVGYVVLLLSVGRSTESGIHATMGVVSALGAAWCSRYGGLIEQLETPKFCCRY